MEGHLLMSRKELERRSLFERVKRKELHLTEACELLGVSYRQVKRSYGRYVLEGDAGLVHRSRGQASNRGYPAALKGAALDYYAQRLEGFGPTLAAEKLAERGIVVDHETLRRWLLEAGLWKRGRRRAKHRSWRERRGHFGELVQMDGSPHHWFGPDGPECTLMNMVDDATGQSLALMAEAETVEIAMRVLWCWIEHHGIPKALYVDRKNIFKSKREPTLEEQLAGQKPMTPFETACHKLGIEIIEAQSPQAKGRVERNHGVYQDRFLKELRLRDIKTIERTNQLLETSFCDALNAKFAKPARQKADYHRKVPRALKLEDVFVHEEQRTVGNDWTISWRNQTYQIHADNRHLPKSKDKVIVRTSLEGEISILHKDKRIRFSAVGVAPLTKSTPISVPGPTVPKKRTNTSRTTPWRQNCTLMCAEPTNADKTR